jgi:hypothetical protein
MSQLLMSTDSTMIYFDFWTVKFEFDSQVYQHKIVNVSPTEQK